jgi:hypothetical protein
VFLGNNLQDHGRGVEPLIDHLVVFSMWRWTEIDVTLGLDLTASSNKEGP